MNRSALNLTLGLQVLELNLSLPLGNGDIRSGDVHTVPLLMLFPIDEIHVQKLSMSRRILKIRLRVLVEPLVVKLVIKLRSVELRPPLAFSWRRREQLPHFLLAHPPLTLAA